MSLILSMSYSYTLIKLFSMKTTITIGWIPLLSSLMSILILLTTQNLKIGSYELLLIGVVPIMIHLIKILMRKDEKLESNYYSDFEKIYKEYNY